MAKCLGLAPFSLSKIMLVRDKILEVETKWGSQCKKKRKNFKTGANKELEKILVDQFQQMRADNISFDGHVLHAKAKAKTILKPQMGG
jgi:hypothetical protein